MQAFVYNANPAHVIFGSGSIKQLPDEIKRLNKSRPILLSTPRQVGNVKSLVSILENASIKPAGLFAEAAMHTPKHVTDKALTYTRESGADCVISFGGGSAVGLGKAVSLGTDLDHVAIATTYSGSEMTAILGETADGRKTTRNDPRILPGTVIYDVDLTMTLPPDVSATSGVNAIAHAVEALYARHTNPVINLLALEGIKALAESLPVIVNSAQDLDARSKAQYGAWLCAMCLSSVGMALHHKLCHTLGGSFNLPHAETHTIVLPHALAYNAPEIPTVLAQLASVLPESDGDAIQGLNRLLTKLKVKRGLKEIGMENEDDVQKAVEIALSNPYWNPREITKEPLLETIRRCWAGEEAKADL